MMQDVREEWRNSYQETHSMILGLIVAILLLAYLVYTLIYPERF